MLTSRGLGRVLGDLASMGFNARWGVLGAADIGANHQRNRIWIAGEMADTYFKPIDHQPNSWGNNETNRTPGKRTRFADGGCGKTNGNVAHSDSRLCRGWGAIESSRENNERGLHITKIKQTEYDIWSKTFGCSFVRGKENTNINWWEVEPNVGRVADGVAARVDRLKAIGNGQVSEVARRAWEILNGQT